MQTFRHILLTLTMVLPAFALSAQSSDKENTFLETLGAASGIMIYNTYVAIGSIADGYEYEAYDSAEVKVFMDEQAGAMQNMATQYQALLDSGYLEAQEDQEFVSELIVTCRLLSDQAGALTQYALTQSDDVAQAFQDYRSEAWQKIAYLLDID
jgi:hypothetical protein